MRKHPQKRHLVHLGALLLALITTAQAITLPILTQRGVIRLGSKTQANVNAELGQVALGKGILLVSSNPGGPGRATIKVSFNGAPMFAKVQGTALLAYLPGAFIEITGVEGRTYLSRQGSFGENVAIDAGKMLLKGLRIEIAGNTVLVPQKSRVMTGPNTIIYANAHDYNKPNFGTIDNSPRRRNFAERPAF